jgi:hypothetical protein
LLEDFFIFKGVTEAGCRSIKQTAVGRESPVRFDNASSSSAKGSAQAAQPKQIENIPHVFEKTGNLLWSRCV